MVSVTLTKSAKGVDLNKWCRRNHLAAKQHWIVFTTVWAKHTCCEASENLSFMWSPLGQTWPLCCLLLYLIHLLSLGILLSLEAPQKVQKLSLQIGECIPLRRFLASFGSKWITSYSGCCITTYCFIEQGSKKSHKTLHIISDQGVIQTCLCVH